MVEIERKVGQGVRVGRHTIRVLAVHAGEVVVAVLDPDTDCAGCGDSPADRHLCRGCGMESLVCPDCARSWSCARCDAHPG